MFSQIDALEAELDLVREANSVTYKKFIDLLVETLEKLFCRCGAAIIRPSAHNSLQGCEIQFDIGKVGKDDYILSGSEVCFTYETKTNKLIINTPNFYHMSKDDEAQLFRVNFLYYVCNNMTAIEEELSKLSLSASRAINYDNEYALEEELAKLKKQEQFELEEKILSQLTVGTRLINTTADASNLFDEAVVITKVTPVYLYVSNDKEKLRLKKDVVAALVTEGWIKYE